MATTLTDVQRSFVSKPVGYIRSPLRCRGLSREMTFSSCRGCMRRDAILCRCIRAEEKIFRSRLAERSAH
jgi:hypothetical protein